MYVDDLSFALLNKLWTIPLLGLGVAILMSKEWTNHRLGLGLNFNFNRTKLVALDAFLLLIEFSKKEGHNWICLRI